MKKNLTFSFFILFFCFNNTFAQSKKLLDKSVRFVYLVSQDREYNPDYEEAIQKAAFDVQAWYKKQLNGNTFKLNSQVVEVAYSDKNAAYFYGKGKPSNGYFVVLDEVKRLLNARHYDPNYIWVIYSDAPDHSGAGCAGVCIMPENDLLGLIGKSTKYPDIKRWHGGLGHEIGHAFGLPHPADTKKDEDAIMWTGMYFKYPNECYLTEEDKEKLNQSPFFFDEKGKTVLKQVNDVGFLYNGGDFRRIKNLNLQTVEWIETKADGKTTFEFTEKLKDDTYYYLKSVNRNIEIRIPVDGGESQLSTDEGKTWRRFQAMKLLEKSDSMRFGNSKKNEEIHIEPIE